MLAKTKIAVLVVAVMALSAPMVYADNGGGDRDSWHHDGGWHHGQKDHMLAKILNLSDDQVKQLKDIRKKQRETMKSTFQQIKSNREVFNEEMAKSTPDMNKVNDLQNQLKTIQAQMIDNHLNSILEVKKIMTPEQYAGYVALKKARKLMMHRGHDKFGHKGGFGKDGDKHWVDKGEGDHDSDSQD